MNTSPMNEAESRTLLQRLRDKLGLRAPTLKESLEEVLEEHEEEANASGQESQEDMEILRKVLMFNELTVEDIMIPRADIVWVDLDIPFEDLKEVIAGKVHTRFPVCRGTLDDVAGYMHIKDIVPVLCNNKPLDMTSLLRKLVFVPPSMKISALLLKMQVSRLHMALVVDEYGGTTGLVTMEDVVEEIVGEIQDEHDVKKALVFRKRPDGRYEISARMPIDELEQKLGIAFNKDERFEEVDTLGGLVYSVLGRIPTVGEVVTYPLADNGAIECEIKDADPRRIKRIILSYTTAMMDASI